jgi:hypothetical protein
MTLSERLRQAVGNSGLSPGALAGATKLSQESVEQLLRGEDVMLSVAEKLAQHFRLDLQPSPVAGAERMTAENPAAVRQAARALAKKVGVNLNPQQLKPRG